MEHCEWKCWCVAEEGFFVARRRRVGSLDWVTEEVYGPLAGNEVYDVMDADSTAQLLRGSVTIR